MRVCVRVHDCVARRLLRGSRAALSTWQGQMGDLLDHLMTHSKANGVFNKPVDPQALMIPDCECRRGVGTGEAGEAREAPGRAGQPARLCPTECRRGVAPGGWSGAGGCEVGRGHAWHPPSHAAVLLCSAGGAAVVTCVCGAAKLDSRLRGGLREFNCADFDIITRPMDFGTVMDQLRAGVYTHYTQVGAASHVLSCVLPCCGGELRFAGVHSHERSRVRGALRARSASWRRP